MASTTCALSTPALVDGKASSRQQASAAPHRVRLPKLPPLHITAAQIRNQSRLTLKTCRTIARNVVAMATGETPAEAATELPEIVKPIQEAWDRLEDKYAVTSLAFAGVVVLWGSTGMISAIDRLPLVPGVLELVGIGYTGWFTYRNLVFKPDREALIAKIKNTYCDIIGTSY